ncbi:MAG TPA: TorF family putative porin [Gallionellaceae bacterium]|nr:TorF family putative porin [Gallionellaceae bacterium]
MHKTTLMVAVLGALCAMPALAAEDAPAAPAAPAITGNVGFTSDYVFNGISQNFRSPALQGGFDYAAASGLYVGTWASNISGNQYTNASLEWDVYGGYNGKVNDDLSYQLGLMSVLYPSGKTANSDTSVYKRWDTSEVILGATWKSLNVKLTYTLTDWYGINNSGYAPTMWADNSSTADSADPELGSKGSTYVEANYTYEISEGLNLIAHAGHQKIQNFAALDYTDYKLAVSKAYKEFIFGLAYTTTNATDNNLYHVKANGDDKVLSGNILAASVSRSF